MFDGGSKQQSKQEFQTAGVKPPVGFESIVVHTIPSSFYDGGVGEGKLHAPETASVQETITQQAQQQIKQSSNVTAQQKVHPQQISPIVPPKDCAVVGSQTQIPIVKSSSTWLIVLIIAVVLIFVIGGGVYYFFNQKKMPTSVQITNEEQEEQIEVSEIIETTPIETATTTEQTELISEPIKYPKGLREYTISLDSDSDGITDIEEQTLYNTDISKPDSDDDGYIDGHEVLNLYNPAGFKPVKLADAGLVLLYDNNIFGYQIIFPKNWVRGQLDEDGREVLFTSESGEYIDIKVYPNVNNLKIEDWYKKIAPQVQGETIQQISTKQKLKCIKSPDDLSIYFAKGKIIYELRYDIGMRTDANFMRTFEMMRESFILTTEPQYIPPEEIETAEETVSPTSAPEVPIIKFEPENVEKPEETATSTEL